VDGDPDGLSKLCLGESDEAPESSDVLSGLEDPSDEAPANPGWNGTREVAFGEFGGIAHVDSFT
jgi:hypothetical protein